MTTHERATDQSQAASAVAQRIRRLAKRQHLGATSRTKQHYHQFVYERRWWFANQNNWLLSPKTGLDDEEALEWLEQQPT